MPSRHLTQRLLFHQFDCGQPHCRAVSRHSRKKGDPASRTRRQSGAAGLHDLDPGVKTHSRCDFHADLARLSLRLCRLTLTLLLVRLRSGRTARLEMCKSPLAARGRTTEKSRAVTRCAPRPRWFLRPPAAGRCGRIRETVFLRPSRKRKSRETSAQHGFSAPVACPRPRHAGRIGVSYSESIRGTAIVPAAHGSLAQHRSSRGKLCARFAHSFTIVNSA